jgi:NADPH-dependent ferric siderophore reductase
VRRNLVEAREVRMSMMKARLIGWLGDRILRATVVESVENVGEKFRRITLRADWLSDHPISPGDKAQIFLPDVGTRTYTPYGVDAVAGRFSLLAYIHGNTPASEWARGLKAGASVRLVGPQSSTPLASLTGPVALFGDETSLAIARCLEELRPLRTGSIVRLEVRSVGDVVDCAATLGLPPESLVARREDEGHLAGIVNEFAGALRGGGAVVLTGRAKSIQKVRALLRDAGPRSHQAVKAYWAENKRGLD